MGAYNHGRLIETFGGTTRQMLSDTAVPLILGH
jgi:nucleotide-binding universal stress UspA family protein